MSKRWHFEQTNNAEIGRQIRDWVTTRIREGWSLDNSSAVPASEASPASHESYRLIRNGFKVLASITNSGGAWTYAGSLHAWGPDGLVVRVGPTVTFAEMQASLLECQRCGKRAETVRIGYANRVCIECREAVRPLVEVEGWNL